MDISSWSPQTLNIIIYAVLIWTIPWKAVALWKAARNGHVAWYIVLMIINTLAILEIIYIFVVDKKANQSRQ